MNEKIEKIVILKKGKIKRILETAASYRISKNGLAAPVRNERERDALRTHGF